MLQRVVNQLHIHVHSHNAASHGCCCCRGFDEDHDVEARQALRWGDPMADAIRAKRGAGDVPAPLINDANQEALQASGGGCLSSAAAGCCMV
jgi:hypothetical protein